MFMDYSIKRPIIIPEKNTCSWDGEVVNLRAPEVLDSGLGYSTLCQKVLPHPIVTVIFSGGNEVIRQSVETSYPCHEADECLMGLPNGAFHMPL